MKANLMSMNILVDSSGSMEPIAADMAGSLNQLVDDNRDLDATVTYSAFSSHYRPVFAEMPIKDVRKFKIKPSGSTALIESACKMIDEVGERLAAKPEEERSEKVMFVIVTDGEENASSPEYTRERLLAKIKEQTEVYNWAFLYLGANQDAINVAASYGIDADRALNYCCAQASVQKVGRTLSKRMRRVSEAPAEEILCSAAFDAEDRES